jgi:putative glutamine amidotransferase
VRVEPESRLGEILGAGDLEVNTRHHQAVTLEVLAPSLTATALSDDGLVEAVESLRHKWVLGVQWHPERPEQRSAAFAPASRRLFADFIRAASTVESRA